MLTIRRSKCKTIIKKPSSALFLWLHHSRGWLSNWIYSELRRLSNLDSPGVSDAGVPGVASLGSRRAEALAKPFQIVCDRQASDEFYVLVADLPREPHAKRPTMRYWKLTAIHAVAEKCLRMQSIGHVDAVPGVGFHRDIHDVSGLGLDSDEMQDVGERHANPLGDVGPALFTREFGDVATRRTALEVSNRERCRLMDHAIYGEP